MSDLNRVGPDALDQDNRQSVGRLRWKRWVITSVKALVAILVVWAVGRHVLRVWNDLSRHEVSVRVQAVWLVVAGFLYLGGLACCGRFYERVLHASSGPIALGPALRAYLVSHLGKYVPGKAMVVVMRAGMSVPFGARGATAAIATFYETLVMMAAGSLIAALGFTVAGDSPSLQIDIPRHGKVMLQTYHMASLLSLALALAFLVVVLPRVFRMLSRLVSMPFPLVGPEVLPPLSPGLLIQGLLWSSAAWVLLGASQLEVAHAFLPKGTSDYLALAPVVIASVALATVAGFVVAVLPGGLGVREGVLMYALAPAMGEDLAVVAALVLRLVWVAAELLAAAVLLPLGPWYHRKSSSIVEADPGQP
jgi:uncharacterized membrane protein YbhN (UPF0104 family)